VYVVLNVSPLTVIGEVPVPVMLPGEDVAVYVIGPSPKYVGGVKATVAVLELAAVAVPIVGALGIPYGVVTLLLAALAGPVPKEVVPVTVNVYVAPLVRPLTVIGEVPVPVMLPGEDVAVYVIGPSPKYVGGVKATVAVLILVAVAVPIVGALGIPDGVVTLLLAVLVGPVPPGVAPLTVNVYVAPFVRPLTVIGEVPVPVMLPGEDVAVYVIDPAPKSVGGVKATVAVLVLVAVAVPIVGSPGTLGHVTAATACIC